MVAVVVGGCGANIVGVGVAVGGGGGGGGADVVGDGVVVEVVDANFVANVVVASVAVAVAVVVVVDGVVVAAIVVDAFLVVGFVDDATTGVIAAGILSTCVDIGESARAAAE